MRSTFYVRNETEYKTVYSCVLMPTQRFSKLIKLKGHFAAVEGRPSKNFIIPGFMTANKKKEKVFENFRSPFGNHGNYVKVLFKIAIDEKLNKINPTRTTFVNLNNANDKRLTEHKENDQVLFAMP